MNKVVLYFRESYGELMNKVTWSTWQNLISTTVLVIIGTIILTLVIALLDGAFSQLMQFVYGLNA